MLCSLSCMRSLHLLQLPQLESSLGVIEYGCFCLYSSHAISWLPMQGTSGRLPKGSIYLLDRLSVICSSSLIVKPRKPFRWAIYVTETVNHKKICNLPGDSTAHLVQTVTLKEVFNHCDSTNGCGSHDSRWSVTLFSNSWWQSKFLVYSKDDKWKSFLGERWTNFLHPISKLYCTFKGFSHLSYYYYPHDKSSHPLKYSMIILLANILNLKKLYI